MWPKASKGGWRKRLIKFVNHFTKKDTLYLFLNKEYVLDLIFSN
jgi:hypothetical protein